MSKQDKKENPAVPTGTHNMPQFQQMQYEFAAWIRKPDPIHTPQNIERRRMDIYRGLFLNNVKNFLENAFPVAARTLGQEAWQNLVEEFFEKHLSTSPYFREIPQEFMAWLMENFQVQQQQPPWLPELLHYEWLELHISTLDAPQPEISTSTIDMDKPVVMSPFFQMGAYRWPVQTIGPENKPTEMPAIPTLLAVYRTAEHKVRFMQLSPQAAMLLDVLQQSPDLTPRAAVNEIVKTQQEQAGERGGAMPFPDSLAQEFLDAFAERGILLGQPN